MVRRFQKTFNKTILVAENKRFRPVEVGEFVRFDAWGVVTCVIHIIDSSLSAFLDNRKKDNHIH
jgi:SOS-response transcriptional repressor LexA